MNEEATIERIRFIATSELEDLLFQLQVDPDKFEEDIVEIEQELIIRKLNICRPIIDLI